MLAEPGILGWGRVGGEPLPKAPKPNAIPKLTNCSTKSIDAHKTFGGVGLHIKDSMGDEILPSCNYSY